MPANEKTRWGWGVCPCSMLLLAAWGWAIWSCAEYWRGNPNYSYGWIVPVLIFVYALRRLALVRIENVSQSVVTTPVWLSVFFGIVAGTLIFGLEFAREQVWHPIIIIWTIALVPIALTLSVFWFAGGTKLLVAELFPILFFLTAVPWPPRFEQPITTGLMQAVAAATTGLLHWFGILAETAGGAIILRNGAVGITEACSGIRSLQAGIMFGLALGEWFLLRPLRRIGLLFVAIALALATNLARTFALSLQADRHGLPAVEKIHDLTGTLVVTTLIIAIWICARFFRQRRDEVEPFRFDKLRVHLCSIVEAFPPGSLRVVAALLLAAVFGLAAAQIISARIEAEDRMQTRPFFSVRADPSQKRVRLPREVWNELHPTSGEYVRLQHPQLGVGDAFHFFWKPSPWNRFVLVHRPDICMPGIGWESVGAPQSIVIDFPGHQTVFYVFRFRRGALEALQLWGVWRNGDVVSLDYQPDQILRASASASASHFEGKRRSATEIVACVITGDRNDPPSADRAIGILKATFQYQPGT